ncbi:MAG: ATP-dependent zinc protease [Gemmatimonadales bacterium]|nr:MAG: ATP-dependent zinc protease [Gemmatimonadales bacterium]
MLVCRSCGGSAAVERRDRKPPSPALPVVGWREWVSLADHAAISLKAKVDTGARTSALHVEELENVQRDGQPWLRFLVLPRQRSRSSAFRVEAPLVDERAVRSSSGASEERPVVSLRIGLGPVTFPAEVTLTRRDQMGFRMLLGRTALRDRFLVNPATSYLQPNPHPPGEPPRRKSPSNPPSSRK